MLDDLEGEVETLPALEVVDAAPDVTMTDLLATVKDVSRGVSDRTHSEYLRLIAQCTEFLTRKNIVRPSEFFSDEPHQYAPQFIVVWIMNKCDELNLDGKKRLSTQVRTTYSTAQKMCASMTYAFGRIHGLGSMHWQRGSDGRMVGNPSVSEVVSRYMLSLHRRKVQAGETVTITRAISVATMYDLYHFNSRVPVRDLRHPPAKKSKADCNQWVGQNTRRLLQLAFSCLLHVDEVLKIQSHDFIHLGNNRIYAAPADVAVLKDKPVRAHQAVCAAQAARADGPPLPHTGLRQVDRHLADRAWTAECFLEMFRNNLIDIGVDPVAYGTHSFRRGGCQWLASDLWWPLQWICEWGGWSTEFTHLTIVKYLISWNNDPSQNWEDFFNLNRAPALKCFACGRSCCCS
ncbi:hypothetical protein EDB89DRAFT_1914099 [Lactarius sanguifluus]|nr:hypothetical protein EDB89DRAFT_1914099 [Lactarius sanguifluus]